MRGREGVGGERESGREGERERSGNVRSGDERETRANRGLTNGGKETKRERKRERER